MNTDPMQPDSPPEAEQQLLPLLDDYWEALQRDEALDPEAWLGRHPEGQEGLGDLRVLAALYQAGRLAGESDPDLVSTAGEARPSKATSFPAGTVLGEFRIEEKLGQGGMGAVYKAFHTKLKRHVVLKVLADNWLAHPEAIVRFQREMVALGQLDHPNIVGAVHAGETQGVHYLIMDLVEGTDLARLVKSRGPLATADACQIIVQVAGALQHAYEKKLVHRDMKPSNLMVTPGGQVKVLDFGLSLLQGQPMPDLTGAGQFMGTADYMAPEQWLDAHTVTIQADLYSLGCTLYYLLAGRTPFTGAQCTTIGQKMQAHLAEAPPHVQRPDVPAGLTAVIERLLAKKAEQRFATPAAVAEALQPFTAGHDLRALLQPARQERPADLPMPAVVFRPPSYQRLCWTVLGSFFGVVLLGIVLYVATDHGTIKIELSDPKAKVDIKVDGDTVVLQFADEQLRFRAGKHDLVVTGKDFETVSKSFTVKRGKNEEPIKVTLVPKAVQQPDSAQQMQATLQKLFKGKVTVRANGLVEFFYDFTDPRQLDDWIGREPQSEWAVEDAWLVVKKLASTNRSDTRLYHKALFAGPRREIHYDAQGTRDLGAALCADIVNWREGYMVCVAAIGLGTEHVGIYYAQRTGNVDQPDGKKLGFTRVGPLDPRKTNHVKGIVDGAKVSLAFNGEVLSSGSIAPEFLQRGQMACLKLTYSPGKYANVRVVGGLDPQWYSQLQRTGAIPAVVKADEKAASAKFPAPAADAGEVRSFLGHNDAVLSATFSPDGRLVASAGADQTIRIWDLAKGSTIKILETTRGAVRSVVFSSDSRFLLSGGGGDHQGNPGPKGDYMLRLWDVAKGELIRRFAGPDAIVTAATLSANGHFALSASGRVLHLWRVADGTLVRTFQGHKGEVYGAALSPDGRLALSGSKDGTMRLWDVGNAKELFVFKGHTSYVVAVAFSPDGKRALSGSYDKTIRLWDLEKREPILLLEGHISLVWCVAFSPDGKRALSGGSGRINKDGVWINTETDTIRHWDLQTGRQLHHFAGNLSWVRGVAFSPDGRFAVSGSDDATVRLWRLPGPVAKNQDGVVAKDQSPPKKAAFAWPADALREGRIPAPDISKAKVLFQDKFNDPKSGFENVKEEDGHKEAYENGKYVILNVKAGAWRAHRMKTTSWGECAYEVVAQLKGGATDAWELQVNNYQQKLGFALTLRNNSEITIWGGATGRGTFEGPQLGPLHHKAIKTNGEINTVLLVVRKGWIEVFINGVAVCDPIVVKREFAPNRLQFTLGSKGPAEVRFERLTVYSAEGLPTPEERLTNQFPPDRGAFAWPADALRQGRISAPDLSKAKRLHHDEFDDPKTGYPQGKLANPIREYGYANGKYFIRFKGPRSYRGEKFDTPLTDLSDFACEVTGRIDPAAKKWGMHVLNTEKKVGISLCVQNDGSLEVWPGWDEYRGPETKVFPHKTIKKGEEFNKLLVIVRGRRVEVYINDVAVCDPIVMPAHFTPARLQLSLHSGKDSLVEFERITVWSAEDLPTPEERLAKGEVPPLPAFAWPADALREGRVLAPDLGKAKVLFKDEFDDPKSGFPQRQGATRSADSGYEKGKYFIRRLFSTAAGRAAPWKVPECVCEVVGRVKGDTTGSWGVAATSANASEGLHIMLSADGKVQVSPASSSAAQAGWPKLGPLAHRAIKRGDDFNTLLLVLRSGQLEVFVNGVAVCDPVTLKKDLAPFSVALWLRSRQRTGEAEFERITVWSAEGLPTPEKRLAKGEIPGKGAALPSSGRTPAEIAARRQEYLDRYLKPLREGKVEKVPATTHAAHFPPHVKTEFALNTEGMKAQHFLDWDCKRLLDPERLAKGGVDYFRGHFDAAGRLRQVQAYDKVGALKDGPLGCAMARYWYDARGNRSQEAFFGSDGKPDENRFLVVAAHHVWDETARMLETRFYDKNGKPAEDHLGVHRRVYRESRDALEYRLDDSPRECWLPALNLGKRINRDAAWHPTVSSDGKEMYFATPAPVAATGFSGSRPYERKGIHRVLWLADRWSDPEPVLAGGKPLVGLRPRLSSDGKLLALVAFKNHPFHGHYPDLPNYGNADIYVTERKNGVWQSVQNAGPKINGPHEEFSVCFLPGTQTLCFASDRGGNPLQLWIAAREGETWGIPRLLRRDPTQEPVFGLTGKRLYFNTTSSGKGSLGGADICMTEKSGDGWSRPVNLGPEVNHDWHDNHATLMFDDAVMYFSRGCPWNLMVTGRADSEAAIRHMAHVYALGEWEIPGPPAPAPDPAHDSW